MATAILRKTYVGKSGTSSLDKPVLQDPGPNTKLLDVAGGTGDIAFRFLEKVKSYPEEVERYPDMTQ